VVLDVVGSNPTSRPRSVSISEIVAVIIINGNLFAVFDLYFIEMV
jgi:hypothetical protein